MLALQFTKFYVIESPISYYYCSPTYEAVHLKMLYNTSAQMEIIKFFKNTFDSEYNINYLQACVIERNYETLYL